MTCGLIAYKLWPGGPPYFRPTTRCSTEPVGPLASGSWVLGPLPAAGFFEPPDPPRPMARLRRYTLSRHRRKGGNARQFFPWRLQGGNARDFFPRRFCVRFRDFILGRLRLATNVASDSLRLATNVASNSKHFPPKHGETLAIFFSWGVVPPCSQKSIQKEGETLVISFLGRGLCPCIPRVLKNT